ncbi:RNA polymerase sigma-54 factor [Rhodovibrio sodomensis]|uniref:RNA polymerase sigma-54 factor n=1 Tax=Rhodovibrio sodomensis TaxID=1088 RepID=A0ABS1DDG8_9PROT|nr:RNA polymerase factor sigma-54 [Rhodovibrio sodomensis]MBK1667924.1 RNA polymerase sigma-54 factor [Rhodovibrio sodomensis]
MALSQRLELRTSQSLVMTPQLQQAIKLLQLNNLELATYIDQELEQNPLLERDERDRPDADASQAESRRGDEDDLDDRSGERDWDAAPDSFADDMGTDWAAVPGAAGGAGGGMDDSLSGIDQRAATTVSLRDHLLEQVHLSIADATDRAIAEALVDSLDAAGYLAVSLDELADMLGVEAGRIEPVLTRLHGFDPAGVFARDLAECLAIQLRERDRLDPAMHTLVANLELVGQRDWARLKRRCNVDSEDLSDMLAELRALDPRPALAFEGTPVQPLVPDILMRAGRNGGWHLELNPDTLPRVLVNQRYAREVGAAAGRDKAARSFLNDRLQSANWLVRALEQRANTILKVAEAIVTHQAGFFQHGVEHLRPLTLREVAETIEMHESTVSRVTANKYIATPRGTYELKYFFTATIQGADGGSHSAEAVRQRIKTLIDQETPDAVLSDDRIVAILRGEGVDIARRTVAKYRDALRIPSSTQRRREKAAIA